MRRPLALFARRPFVAIFFTVAVAIALSLSAALSARDAAACAPAPFEGQVVRIADEEAIISWDSAKQVETFIRRASFRSSGAEFGFLVPTPTKPELGEIDSSVFEELSHKLEPKIVQVAGDTEISAGCMYMGAAKSSAIPAMAQASAVEILDTARVAGYDAVVLAADDPAALSAWLSDHHYAKSDSLTEWLTPYVENHWVLTAFKIADPAPEDANHAMATSSVRMTFSTGRAFYPYREPKDQRETVAASFSNVAVSKRMLRLYFLSNAKVDGIRGDGGDFPGIVKLAGQTSVPEALAAFSPGATFLTVFEDASTPRPGTDDVFFGPDADQSPVEVPTITVPVPNHIVIPVDLVIVGVIMFAGLTLLVRRVMRKNPA